MLKLFSKEVVEKTGRHLFQIGDFDFDFQGFAGILDKSRKMGGSPSFCSTLPGFFVPENKKGILFP